MFSIDFLKIRTLTDKFRHYRTYPDNNGHCAFGRCYICMVNERCIVLHE
mgnify:CR=1 FL=1